MNICRRHPNSRFIRLSVHSAFVLPADSAMAARRRPRSYSVCKANSKNSQKNLPNREHSNIAEIVVCQMV